MVNNLLDLPILLQMPDGNTRKTAIDLQPLDEDALADKSEGGNFLNDAVKGGLIEGDGVLGLILDLSLGPLLFLCGFAATRWRRCFSFSLNERTNQ